MNKYENLLILDARSGEEKIKETLAEITGYIVANKGELVLMKEAGKRELIMKNNRKVPGNYVFNYFKSSPAFIEGYKKYLNMKPEILRHFVVRMKDSEEPKES
ncbi:30S ribosomal protein S6 [candidate division WOR-3 bacterium]|nr:30S ribosomal protein S6 [candidate division WOR-3 bacterium]